MHKIKNDRKIHIYVSLYFIKKMGADASRAEIVDLDAKLRDAEPFNPTVNLFYLN